MPGAHVDLHRWQHQPWHGQRRVAGLAHGYERGFIDPFVNVDVVQPLIPYAGFPGKGGAVGPAVIVTKEHPCCDGQLHQPPNRPVQCSRVPTRKVGSRRAIVRHEQGITDKQRIAEYIGHAGRGMAGHMQRGSLDRAQHQIVTIIQQEVELRTIPRKAGGLVEQVAEGFLHRDDIAADHDPAA